MMTAGQLVFDFFIEVEKGGRRIFVAAFDHQCAGDAIKVCRMTETDTVFKVASGYINMDQ